MYGHNRISQLFMTFGLVKWKITIHMGFELHTNLNYVRILI